MASTPEATTVLHSSHCYSSHLPLHTASVGNCHLGSAVDSYLEVRQCWRQGRVSIVEIHLRPRRLRANLE